MPSKDYPDVPTGEHMTDAQMLTLTVLERTGGSISLVAVTAIFIAYYLCPRVRNVQNTFIVFASISNVGASIASTIAMDGLLLGKASSLCQAQSFMFEMFMQSDPWWALAMSVNVFLVFFIRTSPDTFQRWLWLYCIVCYGGPFVIALALLLVRPKRGLIYGEATIWCWVDRAWDDIRIYTYYMLIWVCILGSFLCYTLVGWQVFRTRNQLQSLSTHRSRDDAQRDDGLKMKLSGMLEDGYYGTVITEVKVTRSDVSHDAAAALAAAPAILPPEPPKRAHRPTGSRDECIIAIDDDHEDMDSRSAVSPDTTAVPNNRYAATVTTDARTADRHHRRRDSDALASRLDLVWDALKSLAGKFVVHDKIKRAYLRTSFLFALSVLVTWIPSSMNRIRSWTSGESPFEYHVATAAVLPLQGLWNAIIFFITSSVGLRHGWQDLQRRYRGKGGGVAGVLAALNAGKAFKDEATAARKEASKFGGDGGIGLTMARRTVTRCDDLADSSSEDDVNTLHSNVELRRMAEAPGKRSSSTSL